MEKRNFKKQLVGIILEDQIKVRCKENTHMSVKGKE